MPFFDDDAPAHALKERATEIDCNTSMWQVKREWEKSERRVGTGVRCGAKKGVRKLIVFLSPSSSPPSLSFPLTLLTSVVVSRNANGPGTHKYYVETPSLSSLLATFSPSPPAHSHCHSHSLTLAHSLSLSHCSTSDGTSDAPANLFHALKNLVSPTRNRIIMTV